MNSAAAWFDVTAFAPNGIIMSGGPESVTAADTLKAPEAVFKLGVPVLGICYGMQTMAAQLGGKVAAATHREYGYAQVRARHHSELLTNIEDHVNEQGHAFLDVWMSHGDRVDELPPGFHCIASTDNAPLAGIADEVRKIGVELGLPSEMVHRHPFPGPGLGVRILGEVNKQYAHLPYDFLDHVSRRIINEIDGITRVTYDISGKPLATIEWE